MELLPGHGLEKAEGLGNSPELLFAKEEQVGLKLRIVEVELNRRLGLMQPRLGVGDGLIGFLENPWIAPCLPPVPSDTRAPSLFKEITVSLNKLGAYSRFALEVF